MIDTNDGKPQHGHSVNIRIKDKKKVMCNIQVVLKHIFPIHSHGFFLKLCKCIYALKIHNSEGTISTE